MIVALLTPLCFCMTTEPTRTAAKRRSRIPEMARIFPRTDIEGLLPMSFVKVEKREGMSMERGGRIFQAFTNGAASVRTYPNQGAVSSRNLYRFHERTLCANRR